MMRTFKTYMTKYYRNIRGTLAEVISLMILLCTLLMVFSCVSKDETTSTEKLLTYKSREFSVNDFETFLEKQMDSLEIPALSIALIGNGEVIYHAALGIKNTVTRDPVDENSVFAAASLVKSVTAFFVMRLSEKGIIDIDRPLHFYLPDDSMEVDQRYKEVTARMVLSHQSGFPNWRWFDQAPKGTKVNRGDFFMVDNPKSNFTYSGEAYEYLGRVIAHLNYVNMNELSAIFQKEVAEPLGMKHAYVVWDDYLYDNYVNGHSEGKVVNYGGGGGLPHINSLMYGRLTTNAFTYAQFLTAIINKKGLKSQTYRDMLEPHIAISKDNTNYTEDGITHWALGFGIKPLGNDTIYRHGGSIKGAQAEYAFSIRKKFGYVFFVNCEKGNILNTNLEKYLGMYIE